MRAMTNQITRTDYVRGQRRGVAIAISISMMSLIPSLLYLDHIYAFEIDGIIMSLPVVALVGYMMFLTLRYKIKRPDSVTRP